MDVGDTFTSAVAKALNRRQVLQNTMRAVLAAGMGTSLAAFGPVGDASAATCGVGAVARWGCSCAGTQSCSGCSNGYCSGTLRPRCTDWPLGSSGNACWCSLTCDYSCTRGYYSCCDCWTGGSGGCGSGTGACICRQYHSVGGGCL